MHFDLAERFRTFAAHECASSSPLYEALCLRIAADDDVLAIAARAARGQPVPNLLLAAVQLLLAREPGHALASFYPSIADDPAPPVDAYPAFRSFVLANRERIEAVLGERRVQTNEVRRCACLLPAITHAASFFAARPLALVEIGTSAGLNLLWDRYGYAYDGEGTFGPAGTPVIIQSSFRGPLRPALSTPTPAVSHRIGLDLNVIDATDGARVEWLRALIWPEHHERRALLDAALGVRRNVDLDLRTGDGFAMLPGVVDEIPRATLPCVYHTHVANQISKEARQAFVRSVDAIGRTRDLVHVHNNIEPQLHLTAYRDGERIDVPLARTDGHARWIEWLARDAHEEC